MTPVRYLAVLFLLVLGPGLGRAQSESESDEVEDRFFLGGGWRDLELGTSSDLRCVNGDADDEVVCVCNGDTVAVGAECDACLDTTSGFNNLDVTCEGDSALCYDGPADTMFLQHHEYLYYKRKPAPRCAWSECGSTSGSTSVTDITIRQSRRTPNECDDGDDPVCACMLTALPCDISESLHEDCDRRRYKLRFCKDGSQVTFGDSERTSRITVNYSEDV